MKRQRSTSVFFCPHEISRREAALIKRYSPNPDTKSSFNVLAQIRKHTEAIRKMLAVTAMAYFNPAELAAWQSNSSLFVPAASPLLQASGESHVLGSNAMSCCCMKKSLIKPTK